MMRGARDNAQHRANRQASKTPTGSHLPQLFRGAADGPNGPLLEHVLEVAELHLGVLCASTFARHKNTPAAIGNARNNKRLTVHALWQQALVQRLQVQLL
jgi:hypothetical protein